MIFLRPAPSPTYTKAAPAPAPVAPAAPAPPQPGIAVVLEILPGLLFQTFGGGNIYAGNVGGGIAMMIGYWASCVLNFLLCFILVGFITWPLTWIAFMIFCPILANSAAKARAMGR